MSRRRGIALAILIAVLALGWAAFRSFQAKDHLTEARSHLATAREALVDRDLGRARQEIATAGAATRQSRSATDDPVLATVAHIPLLGRQFRVVRGISTAADDIARQVLPGGLELSDRLDPAKIRGGDGRIDVAAIAGAQSQAAALDERMVAIQRDVRGLPGGIGPIKSARRELSEEVDKLAGAVSGAHDAVAIAPSFLGADQPRRWFVLVQQFAEARGTGGIVGGYAVLQASRGKLTVEEQGSNQGLKDVHVTARSVSQQFRDRYDLSGAFDIWVNINLSPDLPSVAKLVDEKWRAQGGKPLDGVIALDARSLSLLLKGGPPIALGDGTSLRNEQIESYLTQDQYIRTSGEPGNQEQRKDALAAVAKEVLAELTTGSGSSTALIKGLVAAVESGHLRMATGVEPLQGVLSREGLDGALPTGPAPVAYAVVNNSSASKIDQYLDRRVEYSGGSCDGKRRKTRIVVDLTNNAPSIDTLPRYVTLNSAGERTIHTTTNNALLEVYGTKGAVVTSATLNGEAVSSVQDRTKVRLEISVEGSLPVWQVPVVLPPGKTQRLVLELSEPVVKGAPRVPEQPLSRALSSRVTLPVC